MNQNQVALNSMESGHEDIFSPPSFEPPVSLECWHLSPKTLNDIIVNEHFTPPFIVDPDPMSYRKDPRRFKWNGNLSRQRRMIENKKRHDHIRDKIFLARRTNYHSSSLITHRQEFIDASAQCIARLTTDNNIAQWENDIQFLNIVLGNSDDDDHLIDSIVHQWVDPLKLVLKHLLSINFVSESLQKYTLNQLVHHSQLKPCLSTQFIHTLSNEHGEHGKDNQNHPNNTLSNDDHPQRSYPQLRPLALSTCCSSTSSSSSSSSYSSSSSSTTQSSMIQTTSMDFIDHTVDHHQTMSMIKEKLIQIQWTAFSMCIQISATQHATLLYDIDIVDHLSHHFAVRNPDFIELGAWLVGNLTAEDNPVTEAIVHSTIPLSICMFLTVETVHVNAEIAQPCLFALHQIILAMDVITQECITQLNAVYIKFLASFASHDDVIKVTCVSLSHLTSQPQYQDISQWNEMALKKLVDLLVIHDDSTLMVVCVLKIITNLSALSDPLIEYMILNTHLNQYLIQLIEKNDKNVHKHVMFCVRNILAAPESLVNHVVHHGLLTAVIKLWSNLDNSNTLTQVCETCIVYAVAVLEESCFALFVGDLNLMKILLKILNHRPSEEIVENGLLGIGSLLDYAFRMHTLMMEDRSHENTTTLHSHVHPNEYLYEFESNDGHACIDYYMDYDLQHGNYTTPTAINIAKLAIGIDQLYCQSLQGEFFFNKE